MVLSSLNNSHLCNICLSYSFICTSMHANYTICTHHSFVIGEYSVHYDSSSHLSIIFQRHGSVWKNIWPYCVFNTLLTLPNHYLLRPFIKKHIHDYVVTSFGHTISIFIVSFFVVTRATMALNCYHEARDNLFKMLSNTREIVSSVLIATKDDQSQSAKEWRLVINTISTVCMQMYMQI